MSVEAGGIIGGREPLSYTDTTTGELVTVQRLTQTETNPERLAQAAATRSRVEQEMAARTMRALAETGHILAEGEKAELVSDGLELRITQPDGTHRSLFIERNPADGPTE